jgi:hypothetical protein
MPTIQQENGVKTVKGLPTRWGRRAYRELSAALREAGPTSDRYKNLADLLDEVTAAPLPLDATDAHLCVLAEQYANECASAGLPLEATVWNWKEKRHERAAMSAITEPAALRTRMAALCRMRGITPPPADLDDSQAMMRCTDPAWWRRNLRKVHGRTFEAAAIRLGFVSVRAGAYASDETVARRLAQVARNRAALEAVTMTNEEQYSATLAELANKSTSNKTIRRGELMLRLAGCEDVAIEAGHVGVFITLTAPSKYHAVLQQSGAVNPRFNDSTPRQVQAYLQKTWARIRAAYGRYSIKPYGFRIAEPHHDGCVHWHALVFMRPAEVGWFCALVEKYALAEDGDEPGAQDNRVKFEIIDSKKGSAAAYIAKYISKNINDDSEDAHDEVIGPDGEPVKLSMPSDGPTKASQRVDAWAGVWGIRQFQPIGQPPVTVWRELRRVKEAEIKDAPANVRAAWEAAQRVERKNDDGTVMVERVASYGNYIRAQGGVCQGRDYAIAVAIEPGVLLSEGRYGLSPRAYPVGVYARTAPDVVYASTRYTWTRASAQVGVASPWSPVNNCTADGPAPEWFSSVGQFEPVAQFDDAWFDSDEYRQILIDPVTAGQEWCAAELQATERKANTVWTVPSYAHRERKHEQKR